MQWLEWQARLCLWRRHTETLLRIDVTTVPAMVAGLWASLLPATYLLRPLREQLARQLRATLQPAWAETAPLRELCAVLAGLHAVQSQAITGADVAALVQRLVQAETAVGGPYADADGSVRELTNALVQQCLTWVAEPLPNLSAFLVSTDPELADFADITPAERTLLAVLRPTGDTPALLQEHARLLLSAQLAALAAAHTVAPQPRTSLSHIARTVYAHTLHRFTISTEPFAAATKHMLERVIAADADHEIALLPVMYGATRVNPVPQKLYEELGIANMYAWAAYTIYDDFLDEEGDPKSLATANYLYRAMSRTYREALPHHTAFQQFVEQVLTTVDTSNTLETSKFRFAVTPERITITTLPDHGNGSLLADRALFHAIGPMAVLAAEGEAVGSTTWTQTLDAFRHYLIARQLNDDIHDWADDLRAGQASYVVLAILRHLGISPGVYHLDELLDQARSVFWQGVLPGLCDTALSHIAAAQHIPCPAPDLFAQSPLAHLFDTVATSMHAARQKRDFSRDLLQKFSSKV